MNRIVGRTVLVTGATAGIGRACARAFASFGARLVICGRRQERLDELATELHGDQGVEVLTRRLDVRDRAAVDAWAEDLKDLDREPDVIVNNAGKARGLDRVHEGEPDDWEEMIDTNLKGLLWVTRAFLPGMVQRNEGHVVNIGSIAGHQTYPKGAVYCSTKYGVRALTEGTSLDLVGTRVKVSSIDPGLVETEFSEVRFRGDADRAETVYEGYTPLTPEDVADAVTWVVNTPPHVNILDVVILPTDQRNPYVIHKEGSA